MATIHPRIQRLLLCINDYIANHIEDCEDSGEVIITATQEDVYQHVMKTKEFRVLGRECAKTFISLAFQDFRSFAKFCIFDIAEE